MGIKIVVLLTLSLFIAISVPKAETLENGLARTPPMGWLSWERFTCNIDCKLSPDDCISSKLYRDMADRLVEDGYAKVGYNYVNIDDCWSELEREQNTNNLLENATRFPDGGILALASYVHTKDLKLGIYGDCGTKTCAGYPAQLKSEQNLDDNYFELDAQRLASWQVDSLKFDGCYLDPTKAESVCPRIAKAIEASGRPMLVTCEWPFYILRLKYQDYIKSVEPNFAVAQEACNSWRYFEDIDDSWRSVLTIVDFTIQLQQTIYKYHGPGHWFDPDQLIIGNFGLSLDQARAQMALWSIWSAPLFMSNDLRHIDPAMAAILKNEQLILIDQDPMGVFGLMVAESNSSHYQAFAKPVLPIRNGCPSFAIVYLSRNTLGNAQYISFPTRDLLTRVPISLAAERHAQLNGVTNTSNFNAEKCKQLLQVAMTKNPDNAKLLNKPFNSGALPAQEPIEVKRVEFQIVDLFGDEKQPKPVTLDGELTLKVNPSGVRAIKLQMMM